MFNKNKSVLQCLNHIKKTLSQIKKYSCYFAVYVMVRSILKSFLILKSHSNRIEY